ncbi:hypothetical protein [Delftia tsuruhatensis]|uniref:hypothetical protein n=1 Tax=Delftia tsuruhatensis TaxID=180282 RepID=UPI002AD4B7B1|nr:hypothetical protein [Delftia tsuruhatensis]WQM81742.1 hypothetical protein RNT40_23990 [Delftia tsuruhatensis]
MTTAPTPDLRALAEAAEGNGEHIYTHPRDSNKWRENEAWHRAASPGAVLHLLDSIHELEMQALDLASENSILKRAETEELEARKPLPLSDDDRLRLRSDVARAIWDVMREHEDRCDHALEDVDHKHQVWDCADAAIETALGIIPRPNPLIASREVVADGPVRVTRLHLTDEGRAGLTYKATGPLPGITGGSS